VAVLPARWDEDGQLALEGEVPALLAAGYRLIGAGRAFVVLQRGNGASTVYASLTCAADELADVVEERGQRGWRVVALCERDGPGPGSLGLVLAR
jgi:hypothetical protein